MEQAVFKLHSVRSERNCIAGIGKRKSFEVTTDQEADRIGICNVHGGILQYGIGKCDDTSGRSNDRTSVTDFKINSLIVLDGKDLNGGSELIEFFDLNGSADQDLDIFLFLSHGGNVTDHCLLKGDQSLASLIKFRMVNMIKMFRKILCGKFSDIYSADMGKRSLARTVAQRRCQNAPPVARGVCIVGTRQIVFLRVFAILSDFPISIHVCLPIS